MDKETSEIAKLTERISKDPKSKLFVPLAEEYKKAGDIEMSILVLTEGLKNNPGYVTARSFLGRLLVEKGDLPGAQKEFEEVVKAIPDNLMAQRKLGDLYALQDRSSDALQHYKSVLSLNPGDHETASLVSDIEAGRAIKARLSMPKPPAPPAGHDDAATKKESLPALTGQADTKAKQATAPAKPAGQAPASATAVAAEVEQPEEVLVVEPLEPAGPASLERELAAKNLGFLAETPLEPTAQHEEKGDELFALNEPFAVQQMTGEVGEAKRSGEGAEAPEKQADDFTTDTLAELYISQGFFEKAVDIYERMLVDNPSSQGLKDKLTKVRAMAAEASPEAEKASPVPPLDVPEAFSTGLDTGAAVPGEGPRVDEWEIPAAEALPVKESDYPLSDDEWNMPAKPAPPARRETPGPSSPQAARQPKHFDTGFEPKEYVPPDAAPRQPAGRAAEKAPAGKAAEKSVIPARKLSATGRKETIDRLEGWLKNIKKEK